MKGLVITNSEDISLLEIKELIGSRGKSEKGVVIFNCNRKQLCDLCYFGRSFSRVMELICSFKFRSLEDIKREISVGKFSAETFAVRCIRRGEHSFKSNDIEKIVGSLIDCRVDLKNPQKTIIAFVNGDKFYLGIDYAGFDLGKRRYKIFPHPASLRGDVAYSLIRLSGFRKRDSILDPFCGSGTILIEAALFAMNKSVHYYNKDMFAFLKFMRYDFRDKIKNKKLKIFGTDSSKNAIVNAQKNAKIAGVDINFLVSDVEWIDTRFGKNCFDRIITNPPFISNKANRNEMEKVCKNLFENAKYILGPKGTLSIATKNADTIKKMAEKNGFIVKKEKKMDGYDALIFSPNI